MTRFQAVKAIVKDVKTFYPKVSIPDWEHRHKITVHILEEQEWE